MSFFVVRFLREFAPSLATSRSFRLGKIHIHKCRLCLFFLVLPVFVRSVGLLIHFANSQEGALAEKYRAIHVQKNPDSKTFIVGEKNTQFGIC